MNQRFLVSIVGVGLGLGVFATALAGCSPGYMKASELESKHQGPSDCEARCVELGMRMGALVLVSDTLPGCVCQPKPVEAPKPSPDQTPTSDASRQGASAATASYVVVAAAAAAARTNQNQQQRQQQQSYIPK